MNIYDNDDWFQNCINKTIVYAKHYYTYTIKYLRATKENVIGTSNIRKAREEEIKWGKG